MSFSMNRRQALRTCAVAVASSACSSWPRFAQAAKLDPKIQDAVDRGLAWVARSQSKLGHWTAQSYPTAMTALAGTALLCSGSTTTQGPYAKNIRRAVDYLMTKVRDNGLIGDPLQDNRYTYGHGFSMLFLSQVLGEEEDEDRRAELKQVLEKAVRFSGQAQTPSGGWGYISAKDGNNFDEGSTTITQVQGLRGCRNAGIPVSKEVIDSAKQYIYDCKNADGGISYSSKNRGASRPAITAAALAALFNAGDYDSEHVPDMMEYCKKNLYRLGGNAELFGHWHYAYLYYSQVVYREGGQTWIDFRDRINNRIVQDQVTDGSWSGNIGPIYITSINLTILQLDRGFLPIYQR
ncbi:MAG: terpene cyclase/mutase family protein [Planctomycetales bacterium]|nr:terpene cyclase/mutase family protein [Planctomycetales bacterium]